MTERRQTAPSSQPERMTRRRFLVRTGERAAQVASAATLGYVAYKGPFGLAADGPSIAPPPEHGAAHAEEAASHAPEHGAEYSSAADDWSAYGVALTFTGIIAGAASGKVQLGGRTVATMAAAEGLRLSALKIAGDDEAISHDIHEFFAHDPAKGQVGSLFFVPVLVGMAQGASQLHVIEDKVHQYIQGEEQTTKEEDILREPAMSDSRERWEEYLKARTKHFVTLDATNSGTALAMNNIATSYAGSSTAASFTNNVAEELYSINVARNVLKVKEGANGFHESGDTSTDTSGPDTGLQQVIDLGVEREIREAALQKTLSAVNGPDGYVHMTIAAIANSGAAGSPLADPPNAIYTVKHPDFAANTFLKGQIIAQSTSALLHSAWLARNGFAENVPQYVGEYLPAQVKAYGKLGRSAIASEVRDISWRDARHATEQLWNGIAADEAAGGSEHTMGGHVRQMMDTLENTHVDFYFKHEPGKASKVKDKVTSLFRRDRIGEADPHSSTHAEELLGHESEDMVGSLIEKYQKLTGQPDASIADLDQFVPKEGESRGQFASRLMRDIARLTDVRDEHLTTVMEEAIELFTSPEHPDEEAHDLLQEAPLTPDRSKKDMMKQFRLQAEKKVNELYESTDPADRAGLIDKMLDSVFAASPGVQQKHAREAVRSMMMERLGFDIEDNGEHHQGEEHLINEQAHEVLVALMTQLFAVPSLVHTFEKVLSKTDSFEAKVASTIGLTALTSAFADNVAAYLFGESLLTSIISEAYGEDAANQKQIMQAASQAALYTAVAAGGLSKIGNGPNMLQRKIDAELHEEDGQFKTEFKRRPIELGETLANPYAWVSTTLIASLAYDQLKKEINNYALAA